ncbi:phage N-6-adenine-methyltransferase [Salipiger thiooxidans]|uniref:phage N-6-adenine-methyltransferase n=1 Tax=Salipiger thiooxidans TaxID=282683 RepID=UPI001CD786E2|nr:phage N-6-adenine-methyltransferase [Salipiger thiooxidans]MCA0846076.1 phage N-6-adenine-methyltransferase [Salipiger thiooxidans]
MAAYEKAGESDEWYTPRYIFDAFGVSFDLDVAAPIDGPRYVPAFTWHSVDDDGLNSPWFGFVWMNPPFGHQRTKRAWLSRFFDHGNGIALVPDRTSAPWFQEFGPQADAICWVAPKIKFERPDGTRGESPGTGTALFASGQKAVAAIEGSGLGMVTWRRP